MFTESNGFLVLSSLFYFKNPKRHLFVNIDLIAAAMLDSPPHNVHSDPHWGTKWKDKQTRGTSGKLRRHLFLVIVFLDDPL